MVTAHTIHLFTGLAFLDSSALEPSSVTYSRKMHGEPKGSRERALSFIVVRYLRYVLRTTISLFTSQKYQPLEGRPALGLGLNPVGSREWDSKRRFCGLASWFPNMGKTPTVN